MEESFTYLCSPLLFHFFGVGKFDQIFDQIFGQVFTRFLARVLTKFFGMEKTINTVYSTPGTEKYSVQYVSDGETFYIVLFQEQVLKNKKQLVYFLKAFLKHSIFTYYKTSNLKVFFEKGSVQYYQAAGHT